MTRSGTYLAGVAMLAAALSMPAAAAEPAASTRTLKGELVDARCYLTLGKHGPDHQKCAKICVKDGLPVGLVTADSKYYNLIIQPSTFAEVMSMQAEVTGTVFGESIVPVSVKVLKNGQWIDVKLPEQMM